MEKNMNKHKRDIEQWKSETVQQVRKKKNCRFRGESIVDNSVEKWHSRGEQVDNYEES